jgi:hypothetical protein
MSAAGAAARGTRRHAAAAATQEIDVVTKPTWAELWASRQPACTAFAYWLCHTVLPARGPLGLRGEPRRLPLAGHRAEFDDMIGRVVAAGRPQ